MVQHYRAMVDDRVRIDAFRRAIAAQVRPGQIVADVGCGLGTFAIFACRAGAERVYAIDHGPVLEAARELVAHNGCADRVRFIDGSSTEVAVPERVDLAIFEDHRAGLLDASTFAVLDDLRRRWLEPGGTLLPPRARLYLCAVEAAEAHRSLARFADRDERLFGIDLRPTRRRAFAEPQPTTIAGNALLTEPALVGDLDLRTVEAPRLQARVVAQARREGLVHGLVLWFELLLDEARRLGTGPLDPPSAWRQLFFAFDRPIAVEADARIELFLDADLFGAHIVWRWRVITTAGETAGDSMAALPVDRALVRGARGDEVPRPREALAIDAWILGAIDGARDVAALGAELATRWPARFSSAQAGIAHVAALLARYGSA